MNDFHNDSLLQTSLVISPGLSGLRNHGVTCYVNAVIQALSNCPQLTEYFLECRNILDPKRRHVLFLNYCTLISEIWRNQRPRCFNTSNIMEAFCVIHPMFRGYSQHDAQEFLRLFLVQLHEELKWSTTEKNDKKLKDSHATESKSIITDVFQGQLISTVQCLSCNRLSSCEELFMDLSLSLAKPDDSPSPENYSSLTKETNSLDRLVLTDESSMTSHLSKSGEIGVQLSKQVSKRHSLIPHISHLNVNNSNNNNNHWFVISHLPLVGRLVYGVPWFFTLILTFIYMALNYARKSIPSPTKWMDNWSTLTLDDCLAHYFSETELVGENKYFCGNCNQRCNGKKQFKLLVLPEILTIHLKRFSNNHLYSRKLTSPVNFPLKDLDLRSYLHDYCFNEVSTYDLISVVCHSGGCGGGHYITYAFNAFTENWYEFDDEQVRKLDSEQVETLKQAAYILFYRKRDSYLEPLRQSWAHIPSNAVSYISKSWFVRFWTWAEPGPMTAEFLCKHGYFNPEQWNLRDDLTLPISEANWTRLCQVFGGHSIIRKLIPCVSCCETIDKRQQCELNDFMKLTSLSHLSPSSYAISKRWLDSWFSFVKGRTWEAPGPIDNSTLLIPTPSSFYPYGNEFSFNYSFSSPHIMQSAQFEDDYETLTSDLWNFLFNIYGGGPGIPIYLKSSNKSCMLSNNNNRVEIMDPEGDGCDKQFPDTNASEYVDKSLSNSSSRPTTPVIIPVLPLSPNSNGQILNGISRSVSVDLIVRDSRDLCESNDSVCVCMNDEQTTDCKSDRSRSIQNDYEIELGTNHLDRTTRIGEQELVDNGQLMPSVVALSEPVTLSELEQISGQGDAFPYPSSGTNHYYQDCVVVNGQISSSCLDEKEDLECVKNHISNLDSLMGQGDELDLNSTTKSREHDDQLKQLKAFKHLFLNSNDDDDDNNSNSDHNDKNNCNCNSNTTKRVRTKML